MSDPLLEGGCQCGAVRYRIAGRPVMAALCYCSMCRRANAAPAVAWAMYQPHRCRSSRVHRTARVLLSLRHADQLQCGVHSRAHRHHDRKQLLDTSA